MADPNPLKPDPSGRYAFPPDFDGDETALFDRLSKRANTLLLEGPSFDLFERNPIKEKAAALKIMLKGIPKKQRDRAEVTGTKAGSPAAKVLWARYHWAKAEKLERAIDPLPDYLLERREWHREKATAADAEIGKTLREGDSVEIAREVSEAMKIPFLPELPPARETHHRIAFGLSAFFGRFEFVPGKKQLRLFLDGTEPAENGPRALVPGIRLEEFHGGQPVRANELIFWGGIAGESLWAREFLDWTMQPAVGEKYYSACLSEIGLSSLPRSRG